MKKVKLLISLFLVIISFSLSKTIIHAEETVFDTFIKEIGNYSKSYYLLQSNGHDYYVDNDYATYYVVISEKNNELYLNILFIPKTNNVTIKIKKGNISNSYEVLDYAMLYGKKVNFDHSVFIYLFNDEFANPISSKEIKFYSSIEEYRQENIIETNGTGKIPTDKFTRYSISLIDILTIILIVGLIICAILIFVIVKMIKNNKINVRSEKFGFINEREKSENENYVDVEQDLYQVNPKDYDTVTDFTKPEDLKTIYQKKMNNEITEAEFDAAIKRYFARRDEEEEDEN